MHHRILSVVPRCAWKKRTLYRRPLTGKPIRYGSQVVGLNKIKSFMKIICKKGVSLETLLQKWSALKWPKFSFEWNAPNPESNVKCHKRHAHLPWNEENSIRHNAFGTAPLLNSTSRNFTHVHYTQKNHTYTHFFLSFQLCSEILILFKIKSQGYF